MRACNTTDRSSLGIMTRGGRGAATAAVPVDVSAPPWLCGGAGSIAPAVSTPVSRAGSCTRSTHYFT